MVNVLGGKYITPLDREEWDALHYALHNYKMVVPEPESRKMNDERKKVKIEGKKMTDLMKLQSAF